MVGPRKVFPLLGVATVAVILLTSAATYRTYRYVQHDPSFCTNCHIMDQAYSRWLESAHSQVSCHACHRPDLADNLHQLWVYWTDPPDKPTHAPEIENSVCFQCHRTGEDARADAPAAPLDDVLTEAGHAEHVGRQKIQCIRCHSTSLHRFEPPSDICVSCHKHEALEGSGMRQHCTVCHVYTATGRDSLLPQREDCLGCHEAFGVGEEVFPGEAAPDRPAPVMRWACGECHKPHSQPRLTAADCRTCHQAALGAVPLHASPGHTDCLTCHRPHLWKPADTRACAACHGDRAEHSTGLACTTCH